VLAPQRTKEDATLKDIRGGTRFTQMSSFPARSFCADSACWLTTLHLGDLSSASAAQLGSDQLSRGEPGGAGDRWSRERPEGGAAAGVQVRERPLSCFPRCATAVFLGESLSETTKDCNTGCRVCQALARLSSLPGPPPDLHLSPAPQGHLVYPVLTSTGFGWSPTWQY
jgi:hypothetical protein